MSASILWLNHITKEDKYIVGEKGLKLAELSNMGVQVPPGFVINATMFLHFLHDNRLIPKIKQLLATVNYQHPESLLQVSPHIKKLILNAPLSEELINELDAAYRRLGGTFSDTSVFVSLSSLVGHQTTQVTQLRGEANVMMDIKEQWASVFDPSALLFRHEKKLDPISSTAVIIQKTVSSEKSGRILTADPVHNDTKKIIIETDSQLTHQETEELMSLGKKLQKALYFQQEIIWVIEADTLYVLDTKPLLLTPVQEKGASTTHLQILLIGTPGSPGIATGHIKVIKSISDVRKVHHGDIVVAEETTPLYLSALKKAGAIITEKNGRTSHAALIARELGKPAVVGIKKATLLLKAGTVVTVNGKKGEIYKSDITSLSSQTATRVYAMITNRLSVDEIEPATIDGIGSVTLPLEKLYALCKLISPHPVLYKIEESTHDSFKQDLELIKIVRETEKCTNLSILLPSLRNSKELTQIKHFMSSMGLHRSPSLKLWLTIATPATVITLEDFITSGIDGVSIDLDRLTQSILATDGDPHDPSVLWALERIITTAQKHRIISSLFGTTLSRQSALIEKIIALGISSICVETEKVHDVRNIIAASERRLIEARAVSHT